MNNNNTDNNNNTNNNKDIWSNNNDTNNNKLLPKGKVVVLKDDLDNNIKGSVDNNKNNIVVSNYK